MFTFELIAELGAHIHEYPRFREDFDAPDPYPCDDFYCLYREACEKVYLGFDEMPLIPPEDQ